MKFRAAEGQLGRGLLELRRAERQDLLVAGAAGFYEERAFLDLGARRVGRAVACTRLVRTEEEVRKLRPHELVEEELRVEQVLLELTDDLFTLVGDVRIELASERPRRVQHGPEGQVVGALGLLLVQRQLRLEELTLGRRQAHLHEGDDLTGALTDADVADGVLTRIAP